MSGVLLWTGYILSFLGSLWIIVLAWQKGVLWGVGCLVFPLIQLIYVVMNWKETKQAFFLQLAGIAAMILSEIVAK
jgi:hypothetical protein